MKCAYHNQSVQASLCVVSYNSLKIASSYQQKAKVPVKVTFKMLKFVLKVQTLRHVVMPIFERDDYMYTMFVHKDKACLSLQIPEKVNKILRIFENSFFPKCLKLTPPVLNQDKYID